MDLLPRLSEHLQPRVRVISPDALSERYPFASDRHHTFILEGARDVAEELASRGIPYAFHLERPGHRGPHLLTLAGRAALVITEEMSVPHTPGGSRAGYRRREAFREGDLGSYHRRRNNPLQAGVSRLSPYLHYGHVSPFRVAREAAAAAREGARGRRSSWTSSSSTGNCTTTSA
jgi:deoxyribodipyrimidine photolyase